VLKILKPLERKILSMHFGLDGADRLDDSEISARLNVSVERVKRFRKDSLWRLSRHSDAKAIKELYDSRSL
jgi:DNA-directed RNA polymerase sigma subunit (sigma70/sigma32)